MLAISREPGQRFRAGDVFVKLLRVEYPGRRDAPVAVFEVTGFPDPVRLGTHDQFWLSPEARLVVVQIKPGRVRLGVEAPRSVPIFRSELERPAGAAL